MARNVKMVLPWQTTLSIILIVAVSIGAIFAAASYTGVFKSQVVVTTNSQGQYIVSQTSVGGSGPTVYAGGVSVTIKQVWAYDKSTSITSGVTGDLYHADGVTPLSTGVNLAGTAFTATLSPSDKGIGILYIKDVITAAQANWVDPQFTFNSNPSYITGWSAIKDINRDGYDDLAFTINFNAFASCNSCTVSTGQINLYGWKLSILSASTSASGSITKQVSPTGIATAGDYHYTGYIGNSTTSLAGYEIKVLAVRLWSSHVAGTANTTQLTPQINNGGVSVKAVTLYGIGPQTGYTYGWSWGSTSIANTVQNQLPQFDAANTRWVLFQANPTPLSSTGLTGTADVTQPEWGYPIVFEYGASASFFAYDIWVHTAAGILISGDLYYLTLELDTQASASSQVAAVKITLQG